MSTAAGRRVVAAGLLALASGLGALAAWQPSAPARASESAESLASEGAGQCGSMATSTDAEIQAWIEQELQAAQEQAGSTPDGGYVVLNNRGYNYGPPPGVRLDPLLYELRPKASEVTR